MVLKTFCVEPINPQYSGVLETCLALSYWFFEVFGSGSVNAGQKYCRMLQGEHSAILFAIINLPIVNKFFVLSIFEWLFYTGFTVLAMVDV